MKYKFMVMAEKLDSSHHKGTPFPHHDLKSQNCEGVLQKCPLLHNNLSKHVSAVINMSSAMMLYKRQPARPRLEAETLERIPTTST
jgi:hypothetical protein